MAQKYTDTQLISMMIDANPHLHKTCIEFMQKSGYKDIVKYQVEKYASILSKTHLFDANNKAIEHFWFIALSELFYSARKGLSLNESTLKTYFSRICHNQIVKVCGKESIKTTEEDKSMKKTIEKRDVEEMAEIYTTTDDIPEDYLTYQLLLEAFEECKGRLKEKFRFLIQMSIDNYTKDEIEEKTGVPKSQIDTVKNVHLTKVRNCLNQKGYTGFGKK